MPSLPDDIVFSVYRYLTVGEILIMRQVCSSFKRITNRKQVWVMVIARDIEPNIVPTYGKPLDTLSSREAEVLALHLWRVQQRAKCGVHHAITRPLHQPRSVTWVRLVHGTWLLVASSDASCSSLSIWSIRTLLSSDRGDVNPETEAYLSGPVSGGEIHVSSGELVIALDVRSETPSIEIVGICTVTGRLRFRRLAQLTGYSRLRCMDERFVGFAVLDEVSIPCLVDWRNGSIIKLRRKPDPEGGCAAMAIHDNLVAMVSSKRVEIHVLETSGDVCTSRRLDQFDLPHPVGFIALSFDVTSKLVSDGGPEYIALRVFLSNQREHRLFEVLIPSRLKDLHFRELWRNRAQETNEAFSLGFGARPTTLSWLWGKRARWEPMSFVTALVPFDGLGEDFEPEARTIKTHTLPSADMPALYAMAVRDLDETRGVVAIGNVFGELVLFDFSGSDPRDISKCFAEIIFPDLEGDNSELVAVEPGVATIALAFPYAGPEIPSDDVRDVLVSSWRPHQPDHVPEGWTTDFRSLTLCEDAPWERWDPSPGTFVWSLEQGVRILGTKIPLMTAYDAGYTIFKAGGLLYVDNHRHDRIFVLGEGVTTDDIPPVVRDEWAWGGLPATLLEAGTGPAFRYAQLLSMRRWEWVTVGRNRWQELKDRGGQVDKRWMGKRPKRSDGTRPQPWTRADGYTDDESDEEDSPADATAVREEGSPAANASTPTPARTSSTTRPSPVVASRTADAPPAEEGSNTATHAVLPPADAAETHTRLERQHTSEPVVADAPGPDGAETRPPAPTSPPHLSGDAALIPREALPGASDASEPFAAGTP